MLPSIEIILKSVLIVTQEGVNSFKIFKSRWSMAALEEEPTLSKDELIQELESIVKYLKEEK